MEQKNCPVDVISLCSADGEIRPLRLRLADAEQQMLRIDIEQIVSVKQIPYVGVEAHIFLCRAKVGERECILELKYAIRTHTWCLLRKPY